MKLRAACAALALSALPVTAQETCGASQAACEIDGGSYHILRPEGVDGPVPAIVFLHGAGSRGSATLNNDRVIGPILARGYAVIAPNGSPWRNGRLSWNFRRTEDRRNDIAFVQDVLADAVATHDILAEDSVLGGFSVGASMVAYIACAAPDSFAAFVPVAGNFWRPHPEAVDCAAPVKMLHTHGWKDGTVPIEGRVFRAGQFRQGDVFYAMQIWREVNGCVQTKPDEMTWGETFMNRVWNECAPGSALEFALFNGGHTVPAGWSDLMLDWVTNLPPDS